MSNLYAPASSSSTQAPAQAQPEINLALDHVPIPESEGDLYADSAPIGSTNAGANVDIDVHMNLDNWEDSTFSLAAAVQAAAAASAEIPISPRHATLPPPPSMSLPLGIGPATATIDSEDISAPTLEAALVSVQAQLPLFEPYTASTGEDGRQTSVSGIGIGRAGPSNKNGQLRSVGPELITPSRLAAASNGKYVPTGFPPYTPPPDVIYPPDHIDNPHAEDMTSQPVLENFPAHSLYRPRYLPADIDDRLDKRSVWMGIEKETARAVYFLPPTCQCCKHPAVAQHCDRGWPHCARCLGRGVACIPGKAWGMMRPKGKRRNLKAEAAKHKAASSRTDDGLGSAELRYSTAEKGKARAVQQSPKTTLAHHLNPIAIDHQAQQSPIATNVAMSTDDHVVKKRRRLSSAVEGGTKRARRRSGDPMLPMTTAEHLYFASVDANSLKQPLYNMNGPCPVWAKTRRALQAAAEYFRDPKKTVGASVEIGAGGVARGVILEGEVSAQGIFWGTGGDAGTIMTSIGHSRRQRRNRVVDRHVTPPPANEPPSEPLPRSGTPPVNVLPDAMRSDTAVNDPGGRFWAKTKTNNTAPTADEEPAVAALLMAQRARTPIGIALAHDYVAVPFKVPRPYIVLGWFWVVDAWLEPVMSDLQLFTVDQRAPSGPPERVIWKFRFEWCSGRQEIPWWSSIVDLPRRPDSIPSPDQDKSWVVSAAGLKGSTSVQPCDDSLIDITGHSDRYAHVCENCKYKSERVYDTGDICLNEACSWFFGDASSSDNHIGPTRNTPSALRPRNRILPEHLGLKLRPPEPTGREHEINAAQAGMEYWRGWVCRKCGMAQERYQWSGWKCDACSYNISYSRRIYTDEELRNPSRPVCTGPRQDDGYASWPFHVTRSVYLYEDDIKVVKHVLDPIIFGGRTEVFHLLNHEPKSGEDPARTLLKSLQVQGPHDHFPLTRYPAQPQSRKPVDHALSVFYIYLCGSDPAPRISSLPTSHKSTPWPDASPVSVQVAELVNMRARRMFPGVQEFNSLLIAANPPGLPTSSNPRITLEPNTYFAVMHLGSDGSVRLRPASGRTKQGEVTLQHGDVVGIHAGQEAIEVTLKLDGFGFFCIARQVSAPPEGAAQAINPQLNPLQPAGSKSHSHAASYIEPFPATDAMPDTITFNPGHPSRPNQQQHQDQGLTIDPMAVIGAAFHRDDVPLFEPKVVKPRPRASLPAPPPKPVKPAEAPMTDWYIGAFPLDKKQPMRILPPFRDASVSLKIAGDEAAFDVEGEAVVKNGVDIDVKVEGVGKVILSDFPEPATLLDPPPLSPLPGYDDLEPEPPASLTTTVAVPTSTSKKATPASKAKKTEIATPASTPTGSGRGRKRGPRASAVSTPTPAGSVIDTAEEQRTPSSKSTSGGRGGSTRGRGRGRGRKSGVSSGVGGGAD